MGRKYLQAVLLKTGQCNLNVFNGLASFKTERNMLIKLNNGNKR